jgi:DNA-binding transcriptional MerR regulator
MPYHRLSTAKIARAVGCHPNTVRFYEQIGFIAPAPRSPKGYRLYSEAHLDQMRLARLGMQGSWPGPNIRRTIIALIRTSAAQDYPTALDLAYQHLSVVRVEREQAETAVAFLHNWLLGRAGQGQAAPGLLIGEVARLLNITADALRNWERNNLVRVPRNPANGYRMYRAAEIGRVRVIRLMRQSGYSPMAILRMLTSLDQQFPMEQSTPQDTSGEVPSTEDLRRALDTPRPDEEVYFAADRWLSALAEFEQRAKDMIAIVEEMVKKY